MTVLLDS